MARTANIWTLLVLILIIYSYISFFDQWNEFFINMWGDTHIFSTETGEAPLTLN